MFSRIQIEYRVSLRIQPECGKTDQENFEYGYFLRSALSYSFQKKKKKIQNLHLKTGKIEAPMIEAIANFIFDLILSINFPETRQGK